MRANARRLQIVLSDEEYVLLWNLANLYGWNNPVEFMKAWTLKFIEVEKSRLPDMFLDMKADTLTGKPLRIGKMFPPFYYPRGEYEDEFLQFMAEKKKLKNGS